MSFSQQDCSSFPQVFIHASSKLDERKLRLLLPPEERLCVCSVPLSMYGKRRILFLNTVLILNFSKHDQHHQYRNSRWRRCSGTWFVWACFLENNPHLVLFLGWHMEDVTGSVTNLLWSHATDLPPTPLRGILFLQAFFSLSFTVPLEVCKRSVCRVWLFQGHRHPHFPCRRRIFIEPILHENPVSNLVDLVCSTISSVFVFLTVSHLYLPVQCTAIVAPYETCRGGSVDVELMYSGGWSVTKTSLTPTGFGSLCLWPQDSTF